MKSLIPVIDRLKDRPAGFKGNWFRRVVSGATAAKLKEEALAAPTCWIVRAGEKSQHRGIREERVTVSFEVIMTVANARSHGSSDTDEMMLAYRKAVMHLLLGWEPDAKDCDPINYEGGKLMGYDGEILVWSDSYSFRCYATNYAPPPTYGEPEMRDATDQQADPQKEKNNG